MDDDLRQNLTASETWIRGLFILMFAFLLIVARLVTGAVVVIQFLFTVLTGQTNGNLKNFGASLARYIYSCLLFVTYNSDDKPYPFAQWPAPEVMTASGKVQTTVKAEVKTEVKTKAKAGPKAKPAAKKTTKPRASAESDAKPKKEAQPEATIDNNSDTGTES